ncbi:MAG TPA: serine hydrolase domain-containing protein, partial [Pseudomonadales bacterium]|nr:serine hydrolase domain-containing protein [Pseudomonadales bacterium]
MKLVKSKLLSKVVKLIDVPDDISTVTHYNPADEIDPKFLGMTEGDKDAIWSSVEMLYKSGVYPAISICLRRHGEIVLNRAIGHARGNGPEDDESTPKVAMTPETPACLFSASKAVTAMLVHLLDERGEINLLNPVSYYLPDFAQNGKQYITIQQLLNHRAGIPSVGQIDPEALFDYDHVLSVLYAAEPNKNRKRLDYHAVTAGFILGELVRKITGKDIREFLRENVQIPMNMTYFNYGCPRDQIENVALNYETGLANVGPVNAFLENVIGATMAEVMEISNDPRFFDMIVPAGNIIATAEEASRFWDMLISNGEYNGKRIFDP